MKHRLCRGLCVAFVVLAAGGSSRLVAGERSAMEALQAAVDKWLAVFEPGPKSPPQTFSARLRILRAGDLPKEFVGRDLTLAYQAPDRLRLSATVDGATYTACRNGEQLWLHAPPQQFGLIGSPDAPRFRTAPGHKDGTLLPPFHLPMPRAQVVAWLPTVCAAAALPAETVDGQSCAVLRVTSALAPGGALTVWVRTSDQLPTRLGYVDNTGVDVLVDLLDVTLGPAWPAERWKLQPQPGDKIETVALSHLTRCAAVLLSNLTRKAPPLGPATGERRVMARHGAGRLESIDGTRVLFLAGTPEEMGTQQGHLMTAEIRDLVEHIVYGVGVGSSLAKGRWFFGEIEDAQARLKPFFDERYLREIDTLARAAGLDAQEARLANVFPELFHCSGFALYGEATQGGRMFHGRVLDYLKGVGLEQNAVVMVYRPDQGHAWVNISYAGFVGTVTAMNDQHLAIGEMGGRGEGHWDGKPMAQLLREVMERASTLDEAIEIMRRGPRTCEYYYVISDGRAKRAVGIAATPTTFETVWAGEAHPRLPHAVKDAVLLSAGDRYETLVERVRKGYGKFDDTSARALMNRPVCMGSNIQSVLFAPDTLDFWVANADSRNVASHARYTHYNLADLLKPIAADPPAAPRATTATSADFRLEQTTILLGPPGASYFQSRGAVVPGEPPTLLVTTQTLDRGGAHGYRDVFQIESRDGGRNWSQPAAIETLRRSKTPEGDEVVAGDLCPQWHAASGVVLSTGKTFTFRDGTREDRAAERVSYCVYSPTGRAWGPLKLLDLPPRDHAGAAIVAPNAGCHQRCDLPNGEILLPIRYSPDQPGRPYKTIVARCRFDGQRLTYVEHGTECDRPRGRGLYEPSVVGFQGRYFLTMRADDSAFVARGTDGLHYDPLVEWTFDDGQPLGSYNTQQHWVAHADKLYLCYTRRGAGNDHIFRHRAPLFIGRVDPERLCVVRATEQVLLPENHASLGNFGVVDVHAGETWVIDSELLQGPRAQERNKVLAAKLYWAPSP